MVLSGPAGGGKDSALRGLRAAGLDGLDIVVTYTTRSCRPQESEGVDYHFVTRETFERLRDEGEFLEHAEFAGEWYGTPVGAVLRSLAAGRDVLLKIEVRGAAAVRRALDDTVLIFITPPSLEELEWRLRRRRTESEANVRRRLEIAATELACIPEYDYLVINHRHRLNEAMAHIRHIIMAERCRITPPPVLAKEPL